MSYSIRQSGNGFEVLDAQGDAVAWTLEKKWALKILLGLELLEGSPTNNSCRDDE